MSVYNTYDRKVMEAVRILSVEELLCIVHDVAVALKEDRLRDLGAGRVADLGDSAPIRPGWVSLRALEHALLTAGFEVPGIQTPQDLVDIFGEEDAAAMLEARVRIEAYMVKLNDIIEEYDCNLGTAMGIEESNSTKLQQNQEPLNDDLSGFGWD